MGGKWPHDIVLSGQSKETITYNQLQGRNFMLDYVTHFWMTPKISHGVLQRPAMWSSFVGWSRVKLIGGQTLKKLTGLGGPMHRVMCHPTISPQKTLKKFRTSSSLCVLQQKLWNAKQTHETKGVLYKHVRATLWSTESKAYPHSQNDCRCSKSKMSNLGMSQNIRSHVHHTRFVYNSAYANNYFYCLYHMSKTDMKKTYENS